MKASSILIFALGAAAGAAASYAFARHKFLGIAQEEINSVKEVYAKRAAAREKPDLSEYAEIVNNEGYSEQTDGAPAAKPVKVPYVISPDEFAEDEEYDKVTLYYYADGVLADDTGDVVDVSTVGGEECLEEFGAFEDDAVYVRDDEEKVDYEILEDERTYKDLMSKSPQKIGGKSD